MDTIIVAPESCQVLSYPDPIEDLLPFGKVSIFAGASGSGKTILIAEWIKRIMDGRTVCGHKTHKPTGFYYLAADRDWSTYALAFKNAGILDIPHFCLATDHPVSPINWNPKGALTLFADCLDRLNPIPGSMVCVDPVSPLFLAGDQNKARDVAVSVMTYGRECDKRQITMLGFGNVSKIKANEGQEGYLRPRDRIAGSGAFSAYAYTMLHLNPPASPTEPFVLTTAPRTFIDQTFEFQFDQETKLFVPWQGTLDASKDPLKDRPTRIYALIPDTPEGTHTRELVIVAMETLKIDRSTVYRALKKLVERKLIVYDDWGHVMRTARQDPGTEPFSFAKP